MMELPHYDAAAIAAIRAVVEREAGRNLQNDEGFDSLMEAIAGSAFAYSVERPSPPRPTELEDAIAAAKRLRWSLRALGPETPTGMLIAFMPEVRSGDIGDDATNAAAHANEWVAGLDNLILGLDQELSAKPRGRGAPPLIARNVFWAMLDLLWRRDIGGSGPGKIGDQWSGGIIDFIAACSRPLMKESEITPGKIGEFLKKKRKERKEGKAMISFGD